METKNEDELFLLKTFRELEALGEYRYIEMTLDWLIVMEKQARKRKERRLKIVR